MRALRLIGSHVGAAITGYAYGAGDAWNAVAGLVTIAVFLWPVSRERDKRRV